MGGNNNNSNQSASKKVVNGSNNQSKKPKQKASKAAPKKGNSGNRGQKQESAVKSVVKQELGESAVLNFARIGNSKSSLEVNRTIDDSGLAVVYLSVASVISRFVTGITQAQATTLVCTLMDDSIRACNGYVSNFSLAPSFWWEIRQKLKPCRGKLHNYTWETIATSLAYLSSSSYCMLGAQWTAPAYTVTSRQAYTALNTGNANYDDCQEMFQQAAKELRLKSDPYINVANRDPSAFSQYRFSGTPPVGTGAALGQVVTPNEYPLDYFSYLEEKPKTRWAAAIRCGSVNNNLNTPIFETLLTSDPTTEIGHRLLCMMSNAPKEVEESMPILCPVSLLDIINRTMSAWNAALKNNGVGDGAISYPTSTTNGGGWTFIAYLIGAVFEWFAPWSVVASFRTYWLGLDTAFYNGCAGNNPAGAYYGAVLPACLALQLSLLTPCYDHVRKRTYYPVLVMDCNPSSFTVTGSGFVFQATGTAPWTNYFTANAPMFFDTTGATQNILTKYANAFPVRTFPKMKPGLSLACSQILPFQGGNTLVAMTSHRPTQEELELYGTFVMPRFYPNSAEGFLEYVKVADGLYFTPVLNYSNVNSYSVFQILNNNMLSTSAKEMLEEYDKLQEQSSGSGWLSTGLNTAASVAIGRYSSQIANAATNAMNFSWLWWNMGGPGLPTHNRS